MLRIVCSAILPSLIVIALVGLAVAPATADPTNFSGLKGKDLSSGGSLYDIGSKLLFKGEGKIENVRVVEERANSLTLQVRYSGVSPGDLEMSVGAVDKRMKDIDDVGKAKTSLTSTEGEVSVELELAAGVPEGAEVKQEMLLVTISKSGASKPLCGRVFKCGKKWLKSVSAGNLEIKAVAEPIGQAKSLTTNQIVAIRPPMILKRDQLQAGTIIKTTKLNLMTVEKAQMMTPTPVKVVSPARVAIIQPQALATDAPPTATLQPSPLPMVGKIMIDPVKVIGLPSDVTNKGGKGPGSTFIPLFNGLVSDTSLKAEDIVDLFPNIYEDAQPGVGIYYYLPASYYLHWDEDEGYSLRILYGAAVEGNKNTVNVSARLTSGIDPSDVNIVRDLLKKSDPNFKDLRPLPFGEMETTIQGYLGQFNVDKVSVSKMSDIAGMIDLSFSTDPVTKETIQLILTEGMGIRGEVDYETAVAQGKDPVKVSIPISIKFSDRPSFGCCKFQRGTKFKNASFYPMKLKYIHALMNQNPPLVYSYDLGNTVVPAGASAAIDAGKLPTSLDTTALKMWIEYAVTGDDDDGNRQAVDSVTLGVSSVAQSELTFHTMSPLADTGAKLLLVTVSSKYFDASASNEIFKTVELTKDDETYKIGPVYLVNRQPGEEKPGDPLFKYRLTVVNADGTTKDAAKWVESNRLSVYVGSSDVKAIVGEAAGSAQ